LILEHLLLTSPCPPVFTAALLIRTMALGNSYANWSPSRPRTLPAYFCTALCVAASLHSRWSDYSTAFPSRTLLKKLTSNAPGLSLSSATRRPGSPPGGHSARSCGRNAWLMVGSALPVAVKI